MKKAMSLILTFVICISMCLPAAAAQEERKPQLNVVESEYDSIISIRTASNSELKQMGISEEELSYIKSDKIENELLYRATLPDDILKTGYGYSDEAINLLRTYDGTPLESAPEMRAVLSELSAGMKGTPTVTSTGVKLTYQWSWSVRPTSLFTDIVAVAWEGNYVGGLSNKLAINKNTSKATITYQALYFPTTQIKTYRANVEGDMEISSFNGAAVEFPMLLNGPDQYWAIRGEMKIELKLDNMTSGPKLYSVNLNADYAHYSISIGFGVSFSQSPVSISFNGNYDRAAHYDAVIRAK